MWCSRPFGGHFGAIVTKRHVHKSTEDVKGIFVLIVFRVILGSFGAIVTTWPDTRKWLAIGLIELEEVKFGTLRQKAHIYGVHLTL